ncbi:MAG: hypothetical protein ACK5NG_02045 [Chthoniobacterales bacterium]
MKLAYILLVSGSFAGLLGPVLSLSAAEIDFRTMDRIVLKNGQKINGLIVSNTAKDVTLQQYNKEVTYPKSEIARIDDLPNEEYMTAARHGELPSWQVIVNDLRTMDNVKTLVQIPSVRVDNGVFKNVPYMSFRINKNVEINIYGDPKNPAGIEMGVYGLRPGKALRKVLRSYLAGFLTTREEVAALYSIGLKKGKKQAGDLMFEVTPRTAPDAYGAWWLSIYNKKHLADVSLSDAEYDRLTVPAEELLTRRGRVRPGSWTPEEVGNCSRSEALERDSQVILRGFYRDKNGVFRLLGDINEPAEG